MPAEPLPNRDRIHSQREHRILFAESNGHYALWLPGYRDLAKFMLYGDWESSRRGRRRHDHLHLHFLDNGLLHLHGLDHLLLDDYVPRHLHRHLFDHFPDDRNFDLDPLDHLFLDDKPRSGAGAGVELVPHDTMSKQATATTITVSGAPAQRVHSLFCIVFSILTGLSFFTV